MRIIIIFKGPSCLILQIKFCFYLFCFLCVSLFVFSSEHLVHFLSWLLVVQCCNGLRVSLSPFCKLLEGTDRIFYPCILDTYGSIW